VTVEHGSDQIRINVLDVQRAELTRQAKCGDEYCQQERSIFQVKAGCDASAALTSFETNKRQGDQKAIQRGRFFDRNFTETKGTLDTFVLCIALVAASSRFVERAAMSWRSPRLWRFWEILEA